MSRAREEPGTWRIGQCERALFLGLLGALCIPRCDSNGQDVSDDVRSALRELKEASRAETTETTDASRDAIERIARSGYRSREIAEALAAVIARDDMLLSVAAADCLATQGTHAVPAVLALMATGSVAAKRQVLRVCAALEEPPPSLLVRVAGIVRGSNEELSVRLEAARVLSQHPSLSFDLMRELLGADEPSTRELALDAMTRAGLHVKVADEIRRACGDEDPRVRGAAAMAFYSSGGSARDVWSVVEPLLAQSDAYVRGRALDVLELMGSNASLSIQKLSEMLSDRPAGVERLRLIKILGGTRSPAAVGPLAEVLWRNRRVPAEWMAGWEARESLLAFEGLYRMGGDAAEAVPVLVEMLKRSEGGPSQALRSVGTLGAIGPSAKAALPELRELAATGDEKLRLSCLDAIALIEGKE